MKDFKIYKKSNYILIFLLLLFSCFQNIILISFGKFSFKVSHAIALICFFPLIKVKKLKMPPMILSSFVIFILVVSFFAYIKYGVSSLFLNYIFGMYYIIIIINLGKDMDRKSLLKIVQLVAIITISATLMKILLNINIFITFFKKPINHPMIDTFFGGGVNLEATWIAFLGFSFKNEKKGYAYLLLSCLISALYASRVGVIANVLLTIYMIYRTDVAFTKKSLRTIAIVLIIGIIGLIILSQSTMFSYMIGRFTKIGDEPGSLGRLNMWKYALNAFFNNPFGYGIGNALIGIELVAGREFIDGNIHNMFLQMLLDAGFIGFVWYSAINIIFIKLNFKKFMKDPYVSFIFAYMILSLLQFRGGDSILFIIIGFHLLNKKIGEDIKQGDDIIDDRGKQDVECT